jgi:hypothetical protein
MKENWGRRLVVQYRVGSHFRVIKSGVVFQEIYRLWRNILERHLRKTNQLRWWCSPQEQV